MRTVPTHHGESDSARPGDPALVSSALTEFLHHDPAASQEERLYQPVLDLFHEFNEAREDRMTVGRLRLPEGLRWFLYLGGAATVATVWLLWIESAVIHALLTAAMTWVVVGATTIVLDLDDPYTGDFVVNWRRFEEAVRQMESLPGPEAPP